MSNILRMILGFPSAKEEEVTTKYKIKAKMVNPDLVVMDMKSFRASSAVRAQAKAAKEAAQKSSTPA